MVLYCSTHQGPSKWVKLCQKELKLQLQNVNFLPLDKDVCFQNLFGIKTHLKVLKIKGFIEFGATKTQLFLVEIKHF